MSSFNAQLKQGRVVLEEDAPARGDLPPLHLVIDDEGDDLSEAERARRDELLEASSQALARGEFVSTDEVLARLRALRA